LRFVQRKNSEKRNNNAENETNTHHAFILPSNDISSSC